MESRWVIYGPENGYNFPYPCLSRVNLGHDRSSSGTVFTSMHIKLKSNLCYNIEKTSDEDELQEKQRGIIQQISPNFEIPEPQY